MKEAMLEFLGQIASGALFTFVVIVIATLAQDDDYNNYNTDLTEDEYEEQEKQRENYIIKKLELEAKIKRNKEIRRLKIKKAKFKRFKENNIKPIILINEATYLD